MIKNFALEVYKELLTSALNSNFFLTNYEDYIKNKYKKVIILRHDVDKKPKNSLNMAIIENELNVSATYYFRIVEKSFDKKIIKIIANLGHEIGYHYEDLVLAKGNFNEAIKSFENNLAKLREYFPVKTICVHGNPMSKWDNKMIWNKFDYKKFGILSEPYFNLNFDEIFYLTDTGMKWNASKISVRDKVKTKFNSRLNSTFDIINFINLNKLPNKIMLNTHPQRWSDKFSERVIEYFFQSLKNIIKKQLVKNSISRRINNANQKKSDTY